MQAARRLQKMTVVEERLVTLIVVCGLIEGAEAMQMTAAGSATASVLGVGMMGSMAVCGVVARVRSAADVPGGQKKAPGSAMQAASAKSAMATVNPPLL
jgi:hypothetical protein